MTWVNLTVKTATRSEINSIPAAVGHCNTIDGSFAIYYGLRIIAVTDEYGTVYTKDPRWDDAKNRLELLVQMAQGLIEVAMTEPKSTLF